VFFDYEKILKQLDNLTWDYVCIVWWEPLFYPRILDLIAEIKSRNIKMIRLVTNWVKLSEEDFLSKLLSSWVNSIQLSIHADSAELEEKLTERKWSFNKRDLWVRNLVKLIKENKLDIKLYSNTVPNSYNINQLDSIIKYIYSLWIKNIVVSWIYNTYWFTKTNQEMLCKYSDIIYRINNIKDFIEKNINLEVHWLPLCLHKKILINNYKIRELRPQEIYEILKGKENKPTSVYNKTYKSWIDACNNCYAYWKFCLWVFNDYLDKYWAWEFDSLNKEDVYSFVEKVKNT